MTQDKPALTLGQLLREKRIENGFTIKEVSEQLKITPKYVRRIEDERWSELPSDVYARGFLSSYAKFLGLPLQGIMESYDAVSSANFSYNSVELSQRSKTYRFDLARINIRKLIGFAMFFSFIIFLVFQIRFFYLSPRIILKLSDENIVVSQEQLILQGRIKYADQLTINDEKVYSDKNGNFKKEIFLNSGVNLIKIEAINQFGRKTEEIKRFILNK